VLWQAALAARPIRRARPTFAHTSEFVTTLASGTLEWKRSSAGDGPALEATLLGGAVYIRHSDRPHGPFLVFPLDTWRTFLDEVRQGHYDGPSSALEDTTGRRPGAVEELVRPAVRDELVAQVRAGAFAF
jgi:hypothetical protein